jgi:hypothetical protein
LTPRESRRGGRHRRLTSSKNRAVLTLGFSATVTTAVGLLTNMAGAAPTALSGALTFAAAAVLASAFILATTPVAETRIPRAMRRPAVAVLVALAVTVVSLAYRPSLEQWVSRMRDPDILFTDDFRSGAGWPTGDSGHGRAQYVTRQFQILTVKGEADWRQAPTLPAAGSIQVTTTASLASGQGGWGSWCRGTDDGTDRYWAAITHGAAIAFGTPSRPFVVIADSPVKPDIYRPNSVTIDCRDADGTVRISIMLNRRWVCTFLDHGRLLGPGRVGVLAFAFVDADGAPADARITGFAVRRVPSPVPAGLPDCMALAGQ